MREDISITDRTTGRGRRIMFSYSLPEDDAIMQNLHSTMLTAVQAARDAQLAQVPPVEDPVGDPDPVEEPEGNSEGDPPVEPGDPEDPHEEDPEEE